MKLGHIGIPVSDIGASKQFYDSIVGYLGLETLNRGEENNIRYGEDSSTRLYIHTRSEPTKTLHVCFEVASKEIVDKFYESALTNGGRDFGAPGIRKDYSPTYYAAFVLDPDGNNIEVVFRR